MNFDELLKKYLLPEKENQILKKTHKIDFTRPTLDFTNKDLLFTAVCRGKEDRNRLSPVNLQSFIHPRKL